MSSNPFLPFPEVVDVLPIVIPLPGSDLITLNIYAVGRGPITLIDTGLKIPGALEYIRQRLQSAGFDLEDIERIIVTHGHQDHFGLAVAMRQASGRQIPCFIHEDDRWRVASENYREGAWTPEMERFLAMADMPPSEIEKVKDRFVFLRELCDPLDDVSIMRDGDVFTGDGYHLTVIHTPGHTTGNCCLYESRRSILFSGDHIIKHITPNPLMEIKRTHLRDPDYRSLKTYLLSLEKLRGVKARLVFPGHGEYIEDLSGIMDGYVVHHRERMDLIWKALRRESRPLYRLIGDVFPFVPEGDAFLAVSELLVHLEILLEEGRVELADPGPPVLFRAL
ncbi:MAG: MBL fold metallo-hydrolase [Deltaproteobacteria bacterium]|nr:MBL fold metallo-hydrolase [Deltaproteobacteria bacterium]